MSIQSDIKTAASGATTVVAVRPEIGARNKFKRLPVTIQQSIATYLEFYDLQKISHVDRLFRLHMGDQRVWNLVAKNFKIFLNPYQNHIKPSEEIRNLYDAINSNLIRYLPKSVTSSITWSERGNKNAFRLFSTFEQILKKLNWSSLTKEEIVTFQNDILERYSSPGGNNYRSESMALEVLLRNGLIPILKLFPNADRQPELNFLRRYMFSTANGAIVSEYIPMIKLIISEMVQNRPKTQDFSALEREDLCKFLERVLDSCENNNAEYMNLAEYLLTLGITPNKKNLLKIIDGLYAQLFHGWEFPIFPILISHCSLESCKALLSRIEQWQFYPKILSDALDFARQFNSCESSAFAEALQKVRRLDKIKEEILKVMPKDSPLLKESDSKSDAVGDAAAPIDDEDHEDDLFSEENKRSLFLAIVQDAFGDKEGKAGNVAVFKLFLQRYIGTKPEDLQEQLAYLLKKNSELINQSPERLPFQKILLEEGAVSTASSLYETLEWDSYLYPRTSPSLELSLKAAPLTDRVTILKAYIRERDYVVSYIPSYHGLDDIQKDYDKGISILKQVLKLSESHLKLNDDEANIKSIEISKSMPASRLKLGLEWAVGINRIQPIFFRSWIRSQALQHSHLKVISEFLVNSLLDPKKIRAARDLINNHRYTWLQCDDSASADFIDRAFFGFFDSQTKEDRDYLRDDHVISILDEITSQIFRSGEVFSPNFGSKALMHAYDLIALVGSVRSALENAHTPDDSWRELDSVINHIASKVNTPYTNIKFSGIARLRSPLLVLQWSYKGAIKLNLGNPLLFKFLLQEFKKEFKENKEVASFMQGLLAEVLKFHSSLEFIQPLLDAGYRPTLDHLIQATEEHFSCKGLPKLLNALMLGCSPNDKEAFAAWVAKSEDSQVSPLEARLKELRSKYDSLLKQFNDKNLMFSEELDSCRDNIRQVEKELSEVKLNFEPIKEAINPSSCCVVQ